MNSRGFGILAFAVVAVVVVNTLLAGSVADFHYLSRPWAWIATIVIFAGLMAYVGKVFKQRADGIFIDDRNRISLSRFQLILWTVLIVSALMTAGLSNAALGNPDPLLIRVPPEVWALLGIGAFSFVTAPVLVESRRQDTMPDDKVVARVEETVAREDELTKKVELDTNVPRKQDSPEARWMDLIRGDTIAGFAQIDVSKVQQLAFTVLLVTVYGAALFDIMAGDDRQPIAQFPAVDGGFVALLGLSHAAYLAYKKSAA